MDIFRCLTVDRQKPDFLLKSGSIATKTGWTLTFLISFRKLDCAQGPFIVFTLKCIAYGSQTLFVLSRKRSHAEGLLGGNELILFLHIMQPFSQMSGKCLGDICYLDPIANHYKPP